MFLLRPQRAGIFVDSVSARAASLAAIVLVVCVRPSFSQSQFARHASLLDVAQVSVAQFPPIPDNLPAATLKKLLPRPQGVPQLLLNFRTAMENDLLLQRQFFESEPLTKLLGGAPAAWHQSIYSKDGWVTRVRDGAVTVSSDGVPRLTATFHQEISTQKKTAGQSFKERVSASITVSLGSAPEICVCDVRDWMGIETRLERDMSGDVPGSALVYDFAKEGDRSATKIFRRRHATFAVRADGHVSSSDSAGIRSGLSVVHGHDSIDEFTVSEVGYR